MAGVTLLEENPQLKTARDALEIELLAGETLLGFTQARLNPGTLVDKIYYVGSTGAGSWSAKINPAGLIHFTHSF